MQLHADIEHSLYSQGRRFDLSVSFTTSEDLVVLYGPSGAGKSVTLQCIAGLLHPRSGSIRFRDRVLFDRSTGIDIPARLRRIGYVFQDYALFPHWTVRHNVAAALAPLFGHRLTADANERVDELLDLFELAPVSNSFPHQLSGGQRQRTALARALAARPELLLLDEPFNALDTGLRARMRDEVLRTWQRVRVPIILITHDEADAAAFGRQVITIENGRVVR